MEGTKVVTMLQNKNLTPLRLQYSENNKEIANKKETKNYKRINKNEYLKHSKRNEQSVEERPKVVDTEEQNHGISNMVDDNCKENEETPRKCSGCKDVVILSAPEDHDNVQDIREQLLDLTSRITVDIFDDIHLGKPEYESLRLASKQYHIALIYVTHHFSGNEVRFRQAHDLIYYSSETNQQVIPVFEKNSSQSYFPSIKGIRLENQKSVFLKLIEERVVALRSE